MLQCSAGLANLANLLDLRTPIRAHSGRPRPTFVVINPPDDSMSV
jgi:hypothetical protein